MVMQGATLGKEVVGMARRMLRDLLSRHQDGRVLALWAPVAHARAVVDALRGDGRQVLASEEDLAQWASAAASEQHAMDYAVIRVQPRRMVDPRTRLDWWE